MELKEKMSRKEAIIETLNVRSIFTLNFWYEAGGAEESTVGINWSTIIFIAGIYVITETFANLPMVVDTNGSLARSHEI